MKTTLVRGALLGRCAVISNFAMLALLAVVPTAALADRIWILPSSTVLSDKESWVGVDTAISDDLFNFNHAAMRLEDVAVLNPDGSPGSMENTSKARYRSTFDVKITQQGTYKVQSVNDGLFASFRQGNEMKRLRGTADSLSKEIPPDAQGLRVTRFQSRVETYFTAGKPTTKVLVTSGQGLELIPQTHPNDLVAGETTQFRLLLDGQPAARAAVVVIRGGTRYRDSLQEIRLVADKDGGFSVKWPEPGMYWLNAIPEGQQQRPEGPPPGAAPGSLPGQRAQGPAGTLDKPIRRTSYSATLEVQSP